MKIGIHIDGVLGRTMQSALPLLNGKHGLSLKEEDIVEYSQLGDIDIEQEMDRFCLVLLLL